MTNLSFNINKTIKQLLPYFLVKPKQLAWLQVLLYPLVWLYANFLTYRAAQLKNATVNSTVIRFTRALRDEFADETIYIFHPEEILDQAFIYLAVEGAILEYDYLASENHVPVDYDYTVIEYNSNYDFIVRIPVALASRADEVMAYVKKYAFFGLHYTVETF